jgi:hypothetical protein
MQATLWRDELKATARTRNGDQLALVGKLRDAKDKLYKRLRSMGLEDTTQARRDAHAKLYSTYYSRWLASKYPVVDLSFANGKVDLLIRRTEGGAEIVGASTGQADEPFEKIVSVNRFAIQSEHSYRGGLLGEFPPPAAELGRFLFSSFQRDRAKYREFSGTVKCNRPEGSPKSIKRKLRDLSAILMEAEAAAIRFGVSIDSARPDRSILWMPRIEDMYVVRTIVVRDDPAVLVKLGEHSHLIAFWDSPEESPIEGVLREFSEGTFENVDD